MSGNLKSHVAKLSIAGALVGTIAFAVAAAPKNISAQPEKQLAARPGSGLGSDIRCYQRQFYWCLRRKRPRWTTPAAHESNCRLLARKQRGSDHGRSWSFRRRGTPPR